MPLQYPDAIQAIREFLHRENLRSGAVLPSTRVLAAELGFSHHVIAQACNILISRGILSRTGYRMRISPERPAAHAVRGTVEILSYFGNLSRLACRILAQRGVPHRVTDLTWTQHPSPTPSIKKILAAKPSAVIFWIGRTDDEAEAILQASNVPMVVCADGVNPIRQSSVQTDVYRGTEKALRHLHELGHRHLAHLSFDRNAIDKELAECYRTVCLQLDLKTSSSFIWKTGLQQEDVVRKTMLEGICSHPEVTAIFCAIEAGIWIPNIFSVPERLSVICIGPGGREAKPPLTTLAIEDGNCIAQWACTEIISQLENLQSGRPPKPPNEARFAPELILRESTRALTHQETAPGTASRPPVPRIEFQDTWKNVYPFLKKNRAQSWRQLDLSKLANHSLTRHHGWLGAEPLEHFLPGLRSIHGVPFQVIDEERNGGRAVITFRSPHSHSAGMKELPTRAKLAVDSRVKALYFLHGCGYGQPVPFATYRLHFETGAPVSVPIIPLGGSRQIALERLGPELKPNVQDWWPEFEQVSFPHAHHALVFNPADPATYQRSLYSLEWINPRPLDKVMSIEVRVDPKLGPALALIAVTALLRPLAQQ